MTSSPSSSPGWPTPARPRPARGRSTRRSRGARWRTGSRSRSAPASAWRPGPSTATTRRSLLHAADIAMYEAKRGKQGVRMGRRDQGARGAGPHRPGVRTGRCARTRGTRPALPTAGRRGRPPGARRRGPRALAAPDAWVWWPRGSSCRSPNTPSSSGPITQYVLRRALMQAAAWNRLGLDLRVAVNASAGNLHDRAFPGRRRPGCSPRRAWRRSSLEIEITENTVISDPEMSIAVLQRLRDLGVGHHRDRRLRGRGYSSFAFVARPARSTPSRSTVRSSRIWAIASSRTRSCGPSSPSPTDSA